MAFQSISKCDVDIRYDLYNNIYLSGGSTEFSGISEKIRSDLRELAPSDSPINVWKKDNTIMKQSSAWKGGTLLASLDQFQEAWITRKEYEEQGPSIVVRKCF